MAFFLSKAAKALPSLHPIEDNVVESTVLNLKGPKGSSQTWSTEVKLGQGGKKAPLAVAQEYHVSLAKPTAVRYHQIESLLELLRHKLRYRQGFEIEFGVWQPFTNDDRSRSFLALEVVTTGLKELSNLITTVDQAFSVHGLPTFYQNPRPHISVAWALGDVITELSSLCEELNCCNFKSPFFDNSTSKSFSGHSSFGAARWRSPAGQVNCKIGKVVHTVWRSMR